MRAWLAWLVVPVSLVAGCRASVPRRLTASGNLTVTVDAWARLSKPSGAITVTSKGPKDVPVLMRQINRVGLPRDVPVDLVYVVDTTGSMGDDINAAKAQMREILAELTAWNPDRTIGIVAYRDRGDVYVARVVLSLAVDEGLIQTAIDSLRVDGGGDLREHVYAGLDMALKRQPWREGASHHIVVIGDAPPHEDYGDDPRNYDSVMAQAAELSVKIHTITTYCDSTCQKALAEDHAP